MGKSAKPSAGATAGTETLEKIAAEPGRMWTAGELAADLGVPVATVAAVMRECDVPAEVRVLRGPDGEVVATEAGREKIAGRIAAAMTPPPAAVAARPVLVVWKIHGAKRVLADIEGTARRVLCCVRSVENLMPGLRLEGATEGEGGLWFYYGRLPRRKGRW